jgi:response regulator RpfG family c-di-GMP phosphodiesterase
MLKGQAQGLEQSLLKTVRLLNSFVDYSNSELGHYMQKVARLAVEVAKEAGLEEAVQNAIEMAALIHDIGLLGMAPETLSKDVKLMSPEQFESYSQHPLIASLSLSSIEGFDDIAEIVLCHHEHMDGSGFPRRIDGSQIPMGAKILSVAADYCTILYRWPQNIQKFMANARRYLDRDRLSSMDIDDADTKVEIAENIILDGSNQRYDPAVVESFKRIAERKRPRPELKELTNGCLEAGMTLMQDLRMKDGRLLLSKGVLLNRRSIQSIEKIGWKNLEQSAILVTDTNHQDSPEEGHGV